MEGFEDASSVGWGQGRERGSLSKQEFPMRTVDTKEDNQMIKKLTDRDCNDVTG